jgi:hypothetical protein
MFQKHYTYGLKEKTEYDNHHIKVTTSFTELNLTIGKKDLSLLYMHAFVILSFFNINKGNNKITEHRAIFQRERQNS